MKKQTVFTLISIIVPTVFLAACGNQQTAASPNSSNVTSQSQPKEKTSAFPLTVTDEAGNKNTIQKQPQHIVSVTEGTDEILAGLIPKSELAMVTNFSSDPQYSNVTNFVKGIPQIQDANAETIIAAKPDLVLLASYTNQGIVNQIKQAGIPVYEFTDFTSISSIEKNIKVVGQLLGEGKKSNQLVHSMESKINTISNAVKDKKKLQVLDYSSYGYAAGDNTTVNQMIEMAGGINAAKGLNGWQKISEEEIVKLNPDVIIVAESDKGFEKKVLSNSALQNVNAVKNKQVFAINGADLSSVSQYIINGVSDVAHVLYPDVKLQ